MSLPHVLQIGPYPVWDQERLDANFVVHKYFEAADKDALLAACRDDVRAIATRGELGASRALIEALPKLDPRFLALDNVLVQPHHASGTYETRKEMGRLVYDNLTAHFAGRPLPTPVL